MRKSASHPDDVLIGNERDNELHGNDGEDALYGGTGNDKLYGESQRDFLAGGEGNDELWGADGDDILLGEEGDDILWGGSQDDILIGGAGNDRLYGESGNDVLDGGDGDDVLDGDSGNDILVGGAGQNTLEGDWGNDTFVIDPSKLNGVDLHDIITDFGTGNDVLDLSDLLASLGDGKPANAGEANALVNLQHGADYTSVLVDADGKGAGTDFVEVARLTNGHHTAVKILFDDDQPATDVSSTIA